MIERPEDIITLIEAEENKRRKATSFQQSEIYAGRLDQYVKEYIASRYSNETLDQMPIVSSINIAKRVVDQSSTLYLKPPTRQFKNCSDTVVEKLESLYKEMSFNHHMKQANRMFKAQDQHIVQIVPRDGRPILRNYKMHNIDAVENVNNPEIADAYISSSFDRDIYQKNMGGDEGLISTNTNYRDGNNSKLADKDDFKKRIKRYIYWSATENYIINGTGEVITEDSKNNIGILPFVDFSMFKDSEFFVRSSGDLYDFTIQLNAALSSLWQIVDIQGFAIGYLIGHKDVMPKNLIVGPSKIVHLPISDETTNIRPEFGFVSPNADIAGGRDFVDLLLSLFLTSRGADAKIVNTKGESESYTSGLDRFIAHVEKFQSSEDDIYVMEKGEKELFEVLKAIINNASNTTLLDAKYSFSIPEDAYLEIEYAKPEIVKTESDLIDLWIRKVENDLGSIVEAVQEIYNLETDTEAVELIKKWNEQRKDIADIAPIIAPLTPPKQDVDIDEDFEETKEGEEITE